MSDSLKGPGTIPYLNACTIIVSSLVFSLTTCAPKTIEELFQGLSMILSYIKKIVRNERGSPICNVLLSEQLRKLRERRHVAIREVDEQIHRCAHQRAHEQLALYRVRAPNQHHLRMEGREMRLWVLYTCEGGFGPHERDWYHGIHDRLREWHWEIPRWCRRYLIFHLTFPCLIPQTPA